MRLLSGRSSTRFTQQADPWSRHMPQIESEMLPLAAEAGTADRLPCQ